MAQVWQHDTENSWTLRGDSGEILAVVTSADGVFQASGPLLDGQQDFETLEDAQGAMQRLRDDELS